MTALVATDPAWTAAVPCFWALVVILLVGSIGWAIWDGIHHPDHRTVADLPNQDRHHVKRPDELIAEYVEAARRQGEL